MYRLGLYAWVINTLACSFKLLCCMQTLLQSSEQNFAGTSPLSNDGLTIHGVKATIQK